MPDDTEIEPATQPSHLTLDTGGKRRPLRNAVTVIIFVGGLVAFGLGLVVRLHFAATALGMVCFALGLYAQFVSATRGERIFLVVGITGAFVGLGMGIAHGGFSLTA